MKISKISIKGFRGFKEMTEIDCGPLTTFVGKNDSGKSTVLHALDIFFNHMPDTDDFNRDMSAEDPVVIQVSFTDLPQKVQLEEGVETDLKTEHLLSGDDTFTIKKIYRRGKTIKAKEYYIINDFIDEKYQNLCSLTETKLNELGNSLGLALKKSGSGITNKSKREQIRDIAVKNSISMALVEIEPLEAALKMENYIPDYSIFKADESLNEQGTEFQKQFKTVVEKAIGGISGKEDIENGVETVIDAEMKKIHENLLKHTDEVDSIKAKPSFKWKDLVSFSLECKDNQGKEIPFQKRGSGLRRLLMVAYFQYIAQKNLSESAGKNSIYGIEEPETYLHPGAQRVLLYSFMAVSKTEQVFITTHSSVFAGSTDIQNLVLVTREKGVSTACQGDKLEPEKVAEELGVEPKDQIYSNDVVVFVEGPTDCDFYDDLSVKMCNAKKTAGNFKDKKIALLPGGGDNLGHLITRKAIKAIGKKFVVILDSDCKSCTEKVSTKKTKLKTAVEADGGRCFILKKREAENYLHPAVIKEKTGKEVIIDDFADIKSLVFPEVLGLSKHMTTDQFLERDKYSDKGVEKHELLEICQNIISFAG